MSEKNENLGAIDRDRIISLSQDLRGVLDLFCTLAVSECISIEKGEMGDSHPAHSRKMAQEITNFVQKIFREIILTRDLNTLTGDVEAELVRETNSELLKSFRADKYFSQFSGNTLLSLVREVVLDTDRSAKKASARKASGLPQDDGSGPHETLFGSIEIQSPDVTEKQVAVKRAVRKKIFLIVKKALGMHLEKDAMADLENLLDELRKINEQDLVNSLELGADLAGLILDLRRDLKRISSKPVNGAGSDPQTEQLGSLTSKVDRLLQVIEGSGKRGSEDYEPGLREEVLSELELGMKNLKETIEGALDGNLALDDIAVSVDNIASELRAERAAQVDVFENVEHSIAAQLAKLEAEFRSSRKEKALTGAAVLAVIAGGIAAEWKYDFLGDHDVPADASLIDRDQWVTNLEVGGDVANVEPALLAAYPELTDVAYVECSEGLPMRFGRFSADDIGKNIDTVWDIRGFKLKGFKPLTESIYVVCGTADENNVYPANALHPLFSESDSE